MKTAFLFSGQGAQYPGMMKELYDAIPECKRVFALADSALGRGISKLCFEGAQDELNLTHNTQPCVLAADLAAYEAVHKLGVRPDAVAGFSLGEYAALVAAGSLRYEDAFRLIQFRADAMQAAAPVGQGAMAAVLKLDEKSVASLCLEVAGYVTPANYNCPGQIVVSGQTEAVDALIALAKERKIRAVKLPVSAPFHCEMMKPASDALREALKNYSVRAPETPIYMNIDAEHARTPETIMANMVAQAMRPVMWEATVKNMYRDGIRRFVEFGPGKTLISFCAKILHGADDVLFANVDSLDSLAAAKVILNA